MYILNPFRKEGRAATDLTSTHPPISERIRILRSMAGGASLADYEKAYRQVHGANKGVIPTSALSGAVAAVPIQQAGFAEADADRATMARETSDLLWRQSDYSIIDCQCGTRLKVPSSFRGNEIRCPHCGTRNPVRHRQQ